MEVRLRGWTGAVRSGYVRRGRKEHPQKPSSQSINVTCAGTGEDITHRWGLQSTLLLNFCSFSGKGARALDNPRQSRKTSQGLVKGTNIRYGSVRRKTTLDTPVAPDKTFYAIRRYSIVPGSSGIADCGKALHIPEATVLPKTGRETVSATKTVSIKSSKPRRADCIWDDDKERILMSLKIKNNMCKKSQNNQRTSKCCLGSL